MTKAPGDLAGGHDLGVSQSPTAPRSFPLLALAAEFLSDIEATRIGADNRIDALVRLLTDSPEASKDEVKAMLAERPELTGRRELAGAASIAETFARAEHQATLELQRALRMTPFAAWQKSRVGVGEKQAARLLAAIGHPRWRLTEEGWEPRTVAQLWAYCGYAVLNGAAPTRRRGQQGNWNPQAKMRAYLIAESCIKQATSPFREVYDQGRAKYAESVHPAECKRCGPAGKPAPVGSSLSDGHKHARAMRFTTKAILKDLWIEMQ